ncbi:hypothetical protein A6U87_27160 [Rhizobium sp. AC44/96]|uniref:type II toxin-antitoxin system HipA family toxin n=1 Tax=Rhizobium sp. AC44/96 TaxID=1841654 RepID=UPI0008100DA0|nr:type II toxin-antitoxin system HipA family toxin [Rhizobium sp. AC44/96]OCJ11425.1 hypothetical protein A6U87_27160 [Rhizobium sp. AC44/96]
MSDNKLTVLLYDRQVGTMERGRDGVFFTYSSTWLDDVRNGRGGHALSISMPLTEREHGPRVVEPFIAGLLPDSAVHRRKIAESFGIDPGHESDFEFLRKIGRDCAGAVVFTDPSDPYAGIREPPKLKRLGDTELAQYLRDLPIRPLVDDPETGTRLSLAGVNDKTAVVISGGVVSLPLNGFPSSHILKVDIAGLKDSIKTEHFCLRLAEACGIRVPKSSIHQVEDVVYMRVARYDRRLQVREGGGAVLIRAHQEDMCQALAIHPESKYEDNRYSPGPGWKDMAEVMKMMERPAVDQAGLLDRALFQYLSGNPDAHGKNYAIRYSPNGQMSLSPLYDLNNQAAFAVNYKNVKPRMAMAVGRDRDDPEKGEFWRTRITRDHWADFAKDMGMPAAHVLKKLDEMTTRIGAAVGTLREEFRHTLSDTPLLDVIVEDIAGRADAVRHNRPEPERQQFRTPTSASADAPNVDPPRPAPKGPSMGM